MKKNLRFTDDEHLEELYWNELSRLEGDNLIVTCEMSITYDNPILPDSRKRRLCLISTVDGERRVDEIRLSDVGCDIQAAALMAERTFAHLSIKAEIRYFDFSFDQRPPR